MSEEGNIITIQLSEVEYLRAENDRLREALDQIRRMVSWSSEIGQIIHVALAKEAGR